MIKQIPNILTASRIIIAFFIIAVNSLQQDPYLMILLAFSIATITDFADGKIARKTNSVSEFGKIFDPLSDKVVMTVTLIVLYPTATIPQIIILLLIARDLIIDGIRGYMASFNIIVPAIKNAKIKTALMFIAVISSLISLVSTINNIHVVTLTISILALVFSYVSAFQYIYVFSGHLKNKDATRHNMSSK